jgi:hypothetical protein
MLKISKKRKFSASTPKPSTAVITTTEKAREVEQSLILGDEHLTMHVPAEVWRLLPSTVFVNSLNIARINTKLLPGHNQTLTSRVVSNVTCMPLVISNIVAIFLSDDSVRMDPSKCADCMFDLHKRSKGISVNCKSLSTCIVCRLDIVSSKSAISPLTCDVCNGYIAHEDCIDRVQTNTCFKCTPRESRMNCVGCRDITCKPVHSNSKCTTCNSYMCQTCQTKSECGSCFELTCNDCQTRCLECDEGFCATCFTAQAFDCRICADKSLCRKCSTSNSSCDVCYRTTSVCVLCSTFNTCGTCSRRTCEDCECNCESRECDNDDYGDDEYL